MEADPIESSEIKKIRELSHCMLSAVKNDKWQEFYQYSLERDQLVESFIASLDQENIDDHIKQGFASLSNLNREIIDEVEKRKGSVETSLSTLGRQQKASDSYLNVQK